jgi:small subunit ribosomal protein S14
VIVVVRKCIVNRFESKFAISKRDREKRLALKAIISGGEDKKWTQEKISAVNKLHKMRKNGSQTRVRKFCLQCGRARGCESALLLCRCCLRSLASSGKIPGMTKNNF